MDRCDVSQWSRVCIDTRAARANVRAAPHIQHRRPKGWADRGLKWYKHSLGQWADVMGVGDRECSLMARCARKRAHSTIYPAYVAKRLDLSRPILVQTLIRTMGKSYEGRRARSASRAQRQAGRCSRPARTRSARKGAKRESTGMEQGVATAASAKYDRWARAARISRVAKKEKKQDT
jgi:hypothetical protein